MEEKKRIFVYPITSESLSKENNNYVSQLTSHLISEFEIVNGITEVGLVDALKKFRRTDIYYFNWIENLPEKRFGFLQVLLLLLLLIGCKVFNKKVIWFVHNNISHDKKYYRTKKFIASSMGTFADLILSHSAEIKIHVPKKKLHIFHHPIETYKPLNTVLSPNYDMLIWGAVQPYKGVAEFVEFAANSKQLSTCKILIAGKFQSNAYHDSIVEKKSGNVSIMNKFVAEEELMSLFSQSKYVLFTYASTSVLSSAALCKTLSFGKETIAPNVGSFKELGNEDLVYTYDSFDDLENLWRQLREKKRKEIDKSRLYTYIQNTSWEAFSIFLSKKINGLYKRAFQPETSQRHGLAAESNS